MELINHLQRHFRPIWGGCRGPKCNRPNVWIAYEPNKEMNPELIRIIAGAVVLASLMIIKLKEKENEKKEN